MLARTRKHTYDAFTIDTVADDTPNIDVEADDTSTDAEADASTKKPKKNDTSTIDTEADDASTINSERQMMLSPTLKWITLRPSTPKRMMDPCENVKRDREVRSLVFRKN